MLTQVCCEPRLELIGVDGPRSLAVYAGEVTQSPPSCATLRLVLAGPLGGAEPGLAHQIISQRVVLEPLLLAHLLTRSSLHRPEGGSSHSVGGNRVSLRGTWRLAHDGARAWKLQPRGSCYTVRRGEIQRINSGKFLHGVKIGQSVSKIGRTTSTASTSACRPKRIR